MKKYLVIILAFVMALSLCACGKEKAPSVDPGAETTKSEPITVAPLPVSFNKDDIGDCMMPASISLPAAVSGDSVTMTIYARELFDAVEITRLAAGDTIVANGENIVVEKVEQGDVGIIINKGAANELNLVSYGGGVFIIINEDGHSVYDPVAEITVPFGEEFAMIEYPAEEGGEDITMSREDAIVFIKATTEPFTVYNTLVHFSDGNLRMIYHNVPEFIADEGTVTPGSLTLVG